MATTQKRQHEIAERISAAFLEAYNTGNADRIDDVVTPEFVCHHVTSGQELHGAEAYKSRIGAMRTSFPDFHMEEETLVVDDEMGAGHYHWSGTHEGEFMGVPASGNRVDTTSLTMMRMEGDRMAEMWIYGDGRGLMEQLRGER